MFNENTYQINPGLQIFRKKKCLTFFCSDSCNNRNLQKFISEFWSINIYYRNPHKLLDKTDGGLNSSPLTYELLTLKKIHGLYVL